MKLGDENSAPIAVAGPHLVLMVDDEPHACKWFARSYGDEFGVITAGGVDEALALLRERASEVAVVLTDYHMPARNGVDLLSELRSAHPHVSRLLVSANADKQMAMSAVNRGQVEQILEKPLDDALTRQALRDALAVSQKRVNDQALVERRAVALRETLGFLAHEVTTPLATVRGYLTAMKDRYLEGPPCDLGVGAAHLMQRKPGEVLSMIEAAQRRADYAQSLVSTFVQSARDAYQPDPQISLSARELVKAVQTEYPFDGEEMQWLHCDVAADFVLPGRRDLLYLVVCTLVKNAVLALRSAPVEKPRVGIALERGAPAPGLAEQPLIVVRDNGPGIHPDVLPRLTREPLTTRAHVGGSGMGLLFCQRVMASLGGAVEVRSELGQGAAVRLYFPRFAGQVNKER